MVPMPPAPRLSLTAVALTLMVGGTLAAFYEPLTGTAGIALLLGLILGVGRFAAWLVDRWTR